MLPLKRKSNDDRSGASYTDVFQDKDSTGADNDPGTKEKHNMRGAVKQVKGIRKHSSRHSRKGRVTTSSNINDGNYHSTPFYKTAILGFQNFFQNDIDRFTKNKLTICKSLTNQLAHK